MTSRPRRWFAAAIASIAVCVVHAPTASAWGAQGHHVVARIAWALLTPAARAACEQLIPGGFEGFVAAATWADEVRSARPETYNWHFVDIPVGDATYSAA